MLAGSPSLIVTNYFVLICHYCCYPPVFSYIMDKNSLIYSTSKHYNSIFSIPNYLINFSQIILIQSNLNKVIIISYNKTIVLSNIKILPIYKHDLILHSVSSITYIILIYILIKTNHIYNTYVLDHQLQQPSL